MEALVRGPLLGGLVGMFRLLGGLRRGLRRGAGLLRGLGRRLLRGLRRGSGGGLVHRDGGGPGVGVALLLVAPQPAEDLPSVHVRGNILQDQILGVGAGDLQGDKVVGDGVLVRAKMVRAAGLIDDLVHQIAVLPVGGAQKPLLLLGVGADGCKVGPSARIHGLTLGVVVNGGGENDGRVNVAGDPDGGVGLPHAGGLGVVDVGVHSLSEDIALQRGEGDHQIAVLRAELIADKGAAGGVPAVAVDRGADGRAGSVQLRDGTPHAGGEPVGADPDGDLPDLGLRGGAGRRQDAQQSHAEAACKSQAEQAFECQLHTIASFSISWV